MKLARLGSNAFAKSVYVEPLPLSVLHICSFSSLSGTTSLTDTTLRRAAGSVRRSRAWILTPRPQTPSPGLARESCKWRNEWTPRLGAPLLEKSRQHPHTSILNTDVAESLSDSYSSHLSLSAYCVPVLGEWALSVPADLRSRNRFFTEVVLVCILVPRSVCCGHGVCGRLWRGPPRGLPVWSLSEERSFGK